LCLFPLIGLFFLKQRLTHPFIRRRLAQEPRHQSALWWTESVGPGGLNRETYFPQKGRSILMFFSSAFDTRAGWPKRRRRREFLRRFKWRLPCLRRKIRPVPVTLNLLATDLRVLHFPATRAMGREFYAGSTGMQRISRTI